MENNFSKIFKIIIWIASMMISIFLISISLTSTCYMIAHYSEVTFFVGDNLIKNVLIVFLFILLLVLLSKTGFVCSLSKLINNNQKIFRIIKFTILIITFIICMVWVLSTRLTPNADAYSIQHAVDSYSHGNNDDFMLFGYLSRYPHQIGFFLISYFISLFAGVNNYLVMGIINTVAVPYIYKTLSEIGGLCGLSKTKQLVVQFLGVVFLPTILYTTFIYGNIIGLAFILLSYKYEIKYFDSNFRFKYAVLSFIFMTIALLAKSNYLISLIASIIFAIIKTIELKNTKIIAFCLLLMLSYFLSSTLPIKALEKTTGGNLHTPVQTSSVIAMGLQEGNKAPGWHNGYNQDVYYGNNANITKIRENDYKEINDRLNYFSEHKGYAFKFFTQKIASQWNNPSFQGMWVNQAQNYTENTMPSIYNFLSVKNTDRVTKLLKPFVILIYVGLFLYLITNLQNKNFINFSLLLVSFVGTFVFLIFFEGKCESSMMFFVMLFPISVEGFFSILKLSTLNNKKMMIAALLICLLCVFAFENSWIKEFLSKDNEEYSIYLEWPDSVIEKYK